MRLASRRYLSSSPTCISVILVPPRKVFLMDGVRLADAAGASGEGWAANVNIAGPNPDAWQAIAEGFHGLTGVRSSAAADALRAARKPSPRRKRARFDAWKTKSRSRSFSRPIGGACMHVALSE